MQQKPTATGYLLGLDIGVASVGWARVECNAEGVPVRLLNTGAHLFEPGTEGSMADIEKGKDEARNVQRRNARLMRRQIWRRARRKRKLLLALISHKLLPEPEAIGIECEGTLRRPVDIDTYMKRIDADLVKRWMALRKATGKGGHADQQRLCYLLREAAAVGPVERYELGRALYHLAQRRGFQSNRRAEAKKDEDASIVKNSISDLARAIEEHGRNGGTGTLGGYLASLDTDEQRIRNRWTGRAMYLHEFDVIWNRQQDTLGLTWEARQEIAHAIFHQRPLKNQSNLIGRCSLIPSERRCPIAHRLYQRFRLLQSVNHLEVAPPGAPTRGLIAQERLQVLDHLATEGDLTFAKVRSLLKLKKGTVFNLEIGGDKRIIGHRTDAKLRAVFGERFDTFSEEDKNSLVEDLRSFRQPEAIVRRGVRKWGLSDEAAALFGLVELEEGYAAHSLAALKRLVPRMEEGLPYSSARLDEFPESFKGTTPVDALPPVDKAITELRNPAVSRALTEVRKLINECVRKHGKPIAIRIELARDVKNPRKVRERISIKNREREKQRSTLAERIMTEAGLSRVTREDIEKALLAEECGWICPYTGRQISWSSLFGAEPQFDVEHIWPRSRSLDDSMSNKTLCYHEENRSRKRRNTPHEAYAGDADRFAEILTRIRAWKTDPFVKAAKIARFEAVSIPEGFTNRHLSDTRYIARAAADYVGLLYGGRVEASDDGSSGKRRVDICTGGLTSWLRSGWGIDRLLGDRPEKNRADNRHHAVDAVVVALSDSRAVQTLARAAAEADRLGRSKAFDTIDEPWDGFREDVIKAIDSVVVSHRQSRKVSGPLHDQSIYSRKTAPDGEHRISKELRKLSVSEIRDGRIVDARALDGIRDKLSELGKPEPTPQDLIKIFSDPTNAPLVRGHGGKLVRLRRVRVKADAGRMIGQAIKGSERWVNPSNNHHTIIIEVRDSKGNIRWEDRPVQLIDAYTRLGAKLPIVDRTSGDGERFLFSLSPNDFIEMDVPGADGERNIYRVSSISAGDNELKLHNDGRTADEIKKAKARVRVSGDKLRKLHAKKVRVTYLGEVVNAGG